MTYFTLRLHIWIQEGTENTRTLDCPSRSSVSSVVILFCSYWPGLAGAARVHTVTSVHASTSATLVDPESQVGPIDLKPRHGGVRRSPTSIGCTTKTIQLVKSKTTYLGRRPLLFLLAALHIPARSLWRTSKLSPLTVCSACCVHAQKRRTKARLDYWKVSASLKKKKFTRVT